MTGTSFLMLLMLYCLQTNLTSYLPLARPLYPQLSKLLNALEQVRVLAPLRCAEPV